MQVRVLGCSGAIAAGCRTTAFLVDDDILIDAGTGVGDLELDALARIDHVLLSHSHLDHIASVPLLADSVMRRRAGRPPIMVHALPQTIAALRTHVLNGTIWPDFTRLPTVDEPMLRFEALEVGQTLSMGGPRRIEVLPAVHTVPAVGYAVLGARGAWVFSGDTGPNPALWARLRSLPLAALVIETAFGDEERDLAVISRHLCPSLLAQELAQLKPGADVYITHAKPGELDAVMAQISQSPHPHRVRALLVGDRFDLD